MQTEKSFVKLLGLSLIVSVLCLGTVVLHDSASRNEVARGAESVDGTPSDIKASQLLETVVDNYGACHENAEKLKAWQEWYRAQKQIFESVAK